MTLGATISMPILMESCYQTPNIDRIAKEGALFGYPSYPCVDELSRFYQIARAMCQ